MQKSDIDSVPNHAKTFKEEGVPITAYAIRLLIKQGAIPVRYVGAKPLVSRNAILRYFSCADGCDNAPVVPVDGGIRRAGA